MNDNSDTILLLVEDSPTLVHLYRAYLDKEPWHVVHAETGKEALELLRTLLPQVMVLDLKLPDMDGLDILRRVVEDKIPCSVVVVTGHGSVHVAVEAMRCGAFDFIEKPCSADRLRYTLRNALKMRRLETIVDDLEVRRQYCGFIGSSLPMQAIYRIIDNVAGSKATVFITGESGTGKEVCAEAIHRQSPRNDKPFITLNCAAIPKDLLESELFGHVKGAFTGAYADRQGVAAQANGGTLFLDEICEMDLAIQSKLLRFVQTGAFQKVGGNRLESVDVRLICATNRDPLKEVEGGRFREDLYYRLHVIPIQLPPLREREDDVMTIAQHFLAVFSLEEGRHFTGFAPETEARFHVYPWPGNVRQLQNVIRNIVVLHQGELVTPEMLPPPLDRTISASAAGTSTSQTQEIRASATMASIRPLWLEEKEIIERALALCEGNIPKTAALLEISPSTIYRKRLSWQESKSTDEGDLCRR
ncbi:MAG: sigma-54 dependent transcriptional regulator [Methylococcaceae bacterium]|nr:sigma-54 dependent transcriptional regulator [Methylococcaceae bacterium]